MKKRHIIVEDEQRPMTPTGAWLRFAGLCVGAVALGTLLGWLILSPIIGG